MALNGWQRLFAVFAGGLLITCLYSAYGALDENQPLLGPDEMQLSPQVLYSHRVALGDDTILARFHVENVYGFNSVRNGPNELAYELTHDWRAARDSALRNRARARSNMRWLMTILWLTMWLVALVVVYCIGALVAWVRRGFQQGAASAS